MKAAVIREFGPAQVLRTEDLPDPIARVGWTTVRLRAAGLNWHDVLVRQGRYASPLPHVPGADGAGIDEQSGAAVVILPSLFWGGREAAPSSSWEILGDRRPGTYAERVAVPRDCVVPKPAGFSWQEAAALPLVGLTTYRALFSRGRLTKSENVLIIGAGGGVATAATALASAIGANVFVTASSEEKLARARERGARDGVLHSGEHDQTWPEEARALVKDGFDLVLDPVGRWREAIRSLRPGGRLVVLGSNAAEKAELAIRPYYFGQFDLLGTTMGSPRDFRGLLDLLGSARVPPPVLDSTYALDQAHLAHERLESGAAFGKVTLSI